MSKINKVLFILIAMTLLLIQNHYVIANTLNSSQMYFKVRFSGEPQVSNTNKVKALITDDLSATINVTDMTWNENKEIATYMVQNVSTDLLADLSLKITNDNEEYFKVSSKIEKTTLNKGEATKITITIELIKQPIVKSENATIGIQIQAEPVQPTGVDGETSNDNKINTNINSTINNIKDYYKKDDTPKTGKSLVQSILGG